MKDFIIIGNQNTVICKEIFPLIKENKMWIGYTYPKAFSTPLNKIENSTTQYEENGMVYQKFGNICWFTNFDIEKRKEHIPLSKKYEENEKHYPKYDYFDAIEVSKTKNIPYDYQGIMAVPITFVSKYCPEQFEIVEAANRYLLSDYFNVNDKVASERGHCCNINGKPTYCRILIRRK